MVATTAETERELLLKLAEEYQRKGYQVAFEPGTEDLPSFLKRFRPNMIAVGSDESVVVEVKSRSSVEPDAEYIRSLAQAVEEQSGWRFEFVIVSLEDRNADTKLAIAAQKQEDLGRQEIESGLQSVRQIVATHPESAMLYAWSLTEAALRLLAKKEEIGLRRFDSLYVLKELVYEGVISRSDYQVLTSMLSLRNAIAHGFKVAQLTSATICELVDVAEHLLSLPSLNEVTD